MFGQHYQRYQGVKHDRIQNLARGRSRQCLGDQARTVSWGKSLVVEGDASDARFEHDDTLSD